MVVKLERKRYLLVEFFPRVIPKKLLIKALREKVSELTGQIGLATSSLHVVDIVDNYAVIRATHKSRQVVEAAIQLLDFDEIIPVVRFVSGSIKNIRHRLPSN